MAHAGPHRRSSRQALRSWADRSSPGDDRPSGCCTGTARESSAAGGAGSVGLTGRFRKTVHGLADVAEGVDEPVGRLRALLGGLESYDRRRQRLCARSRARPGRCADGAAVRAVGRVKADVDGNPLTTAGQGGSRVEEPACLIHAPNESVAPSEIESSPPCTTPRGTPPSTGSRTPTPGPAATIPQSGSARRRPPPRTR
jgi:hypothetical protein